MFKTHKIIPPGAISWDDSGNNKAYQSKQAAFVMNPTSIYAYLDGNDKDLQKVTGLFPVPAGPKGSVSQIDTWSLGLFKKSPYPELGKGLIEYYPAARQLRQDRPVDRRALGAGLQAPLRQPVLEGEAGLQALHPDGGDRASRSATRARRLRRPARSSTRYVIGKMVQRVLVENWPAEKAVEEAHKVVAEMYARHAKG